MKISYCRYKLNPAVNLSNTVPAGRPSEGALLRVQWFQGPCGYSDCHPWPEFGDEPLDKQIELLSRGRLTALTEQSIWMAKRDAVLRREKLNALKIYARPKNHFLITDYKIVTDWDLSQAKLSGFGTIKVKLGREPEAEAEWLNRICKMFGFRIRADFNAKGDFSSFHNFMQKIAPYTKLRIEYIEDPMPYDIKAWREASDLAPLAMDLESKKVNWEVEKLPFKHLVLKPAIQDVDVMMAHCRIKDLKVSISSYMDHPVGIVHAAYVASEIKKKYPATMIDCGLLSQKIYQFNDFMAHIEIQGPYLQGTKGTGIGFDDLLKQQAWVPLKS